MVPPHPPGPPAPWPRCTSWRMSRREETACQDLPEALRLEQDCPERPAGSEAPGAAHAVEGEWAVSYHGTKTGRTKSDIMMGISGWGIHTHTTPDPVCRGQAIQGHPPEHHEVHRGLGTRGVRCPESRLSLSLSCPYSECLF